MKKYFSLSFVIVLFALIFFLGKNLNPFDPRMFSFHDDTQATRVQQFAFNLQNGIFPPRIAPNISYNLGFPLFNFYAPFSYWITTGLFLLGISIPIAIKFSFLLAIVFAFIFMYLFLRNFFNEQACLIGGVFYASSLWFAVEIFVRGNMGEIWFMTLFPFALFSLLVNSKKNTHVTFSLTVFALFALFTVHNVLSLYSFGIIMLFILLLSNKKSNIFAFMFALMLGSYFLIPALLESHLTYASQVASKTFYQDHFLCTWQMWKAPKWDYSGSAKGCFDDGMPFVLGKLHIIAGFIGMILYLIKIKKEKTNRKIFSFILLLGIFSLFLTTYQSSFVWELLNPVFSLFQFPWRFLVFGVFLCAFFASYGFERINIRFKKIVFFIIVLVILITSSKYFSKPWLYSVNEFIINLASEKYITQKAAYRIAEYLPKTANYTYWRSIEDKQINLHTNKPAYSINFPIITLIDKPFQKKIKINKPGSVFLNVHYFPFWKIVVNNTQYIPNKFDNLGRPILNLSQPANIDIIYSQTLIEQASNIVTLISMLFLISILIYKPIWHKLKPILK